jgi:hypothetical protein
MRVIKPTPITDSNLLSSSIVENDYAVWSGATTYGLAARVLRPNHKMYESLVASNLNNIPENTTITSLPSTPKWLDLGYSNRWRMFDSLVSSSSTATTSMSVTVATSNINAISLFGLVGTLATVTLTNLTTGMVDYTSTNSLQGAIVSDWYSYFFADPIQIDQLVLSNLPSVYNGSLTITITNTTGQPVGCGQFVVGKAVYLGAIQYGATAGIIDYSKKDTDVYGNVSFIQRAFSKRLTSKLLVDNISINSLQQTLASYRATPCVWIGTDDPTYGSLVVYGFYKDFSIEVTYVSNSYCSLEIEGLI